MNIVCFAFQKIIGEMAMSIFKCKICGGTLETSGTDSVGRCEYCKKIQTLPALPDNYIIFLYGRANHLRRSKRFDKAMPVYQQICSENPTDAESYWSLLLCHYGVSYHIYRSNFEITTLVDRVRPVSVFDDENYRLALKYAAPGQKEIYQAEAEEIDGICKNILAIAEKTEPYDVFITCRQKDSKNRLTQDHQIAQELYSQLTEEGIKVFYPGVSLKGMSENESAAHRYTALYSAKSMAVLGTRSEYFNDVEVRNDWSSYLELNGRDIEKTVISAYMGMSEKDLPEELRRWNSHDMSEISFMRDVIQEIESGVKPEAKRISYITYHEEEVDIAKLLGEAFSCVENGEYDDAEKKLDEVLKADEENAEAYLGKLMAEYKAKTTGDLKHCTQPFFESDNYQKIMKYGSGMLKTELQGYIDYINQNNLDNVLERKYRIACKLYSEGKFNRASIVKARTIFELLADYKDSSVLAQKCRELVREIDKNKQYEFAVTYYDEADRAYQRAVSENSLSLLENAVEKITESERILISINNSREYDDRIDDCRAKKEEYVSRKDEIQQRIETIRQTEEQKKKKAKRTKLAIAGLLLTGIVVAVVAGAVMLLNW